MQNCCLIINKKWTFSQIWCNKNQRPEFLMFIQLIPLIISKISSPIYHWRTRRFFNEPQDILKVKRSLKEGNVKQDSLNRQNNRFNGSISFLLILKKVSIEIKIIVYNERISHDGVYNQSLLLILKSHSQIIQSFYFEKTFIFRTSPEKEVFYPPQITLKNTQIKVPAH